MASDLNRLVAGKTIEDVKVSFWPIVATDHDSFIKHLIGQKVRSVTRLGKWVKFNFRSESSLLAHLKMTGQFISGPWPSDEFPNKFSDASSAWPPHARAAFLFSDGKRKEAIFYSDVRKFGRLRLFDKSSVDGFLKSLKLGPDALTISRQDFHNRIVGSKKPIKQVLLDQTVLAGLGNIYADESLFAAGLSPHRKARELAEQESGRLLVEIKRILIEAIENRGSTVDNYQSLEGPGSYQSSHQVYGKGGRLCPKCSGALVRTIIGGRSSVHCPNCQS
jgi:formamidopyrimidine-DNA glycosylase